jgi:NADH dehydrogenase [ubiquinone] 1 alpha subcomplex assembly factor 1
MISLIVMSVILSMDPAPWQAINDGVMGGVSSGRMVQIDNNLRFEGLLSLENSGGFASVRRFIAEDLSKTSGVRLQIRSDERRYQFRLRQDGRYDGIAWRAEFTTTGDWQTLELRYSEFVPVFRGRQVRDAGPVAPSSIRQVGFMLADKTAGPFRLDIRSIEFLGNRHHNCGTENKHENHGTPD